MRILVAEDSATMRRVLHMTFAGENAELLTVESGELALQRGREFRPDIAFIDASLPGIDGYEVTRALKSDPQLSSTPVILMASQHHPLDAARAAEVGADDHILKPFDSEEVISKARQLTGGFGASVSARPSAPGPRYRPSPPPLPASQPVPFSASPNPYSSIPAQRPMPSQPSVPISMTPSYSSSPAPYASAPAPRSAAPSLRVTGENGVSGSVAERLVALGLTKEQVDGVLALSAEVVERVVWEVVPELAEAMIREELHRLID